MATTTTTTTTTTTPCAWRAALMQSVLVHYHRQSVLEQFLRRRRRCADDDDDDEMRARQLRTLVWRQRAQCADLPIARCDVALTAPDDGGVGCAENDRRRRHSAYAWIMANRLYFLFDFAATELVRGRDEWIFAMKTHYDWLSGSVYFFSCVERAGGADVFPLLMEKMVVGSAISPETEMMSAVPVASATFYIVEGTWRLGVLQTLTFWENLRRLWRTLGSRRPEAEAIIDLLFAAWTVGAARSSSRERARLMAGVERVFGSSFFLVRARYLAVRRTVGSVLLRGIALESLPFRDLCRAMRVARSLAEVDDPYPWSVGFGNGSDDEKKGFAYGYSHEFWKDVFYRLLQSEYIFSRDASSETETEADADARCLREAVARLAYEIADPLGLRTLLFFAVVRFIYVGAMAGVEHPDIWDWLEREFAAAPLGWQEYIAFCDLCLTSICPPPLSHFRDEVKRGIFLKVLSTCVRLAPRAQSRNRAVPRWWYLLFRALELDRYHFACLFFSLLHDAWAAGQQTSSGPGVSHTLSRVPAPHFRVLRLERLLLEDDRDASSSPSLSVLFRDEKYWNVFSVNTAAEGEYLFAAYATHMFLLVASLEAVRESGGRTLSATNRDFLFRCFPALSSLAGERGYLIEWFFKSAVVVDIHEARVSEFRRRARCPWRIASRAFATTADADADDDTARDWLPFIARKYPMHLCLESSAAGVMPPGDVVTPAGVMPPDDDDICGVCYVRSASRSQFYSLMCGHRFCGPCVGRAFFRWEDKKLTRVRTGCPYCRRPSAVTGAGTGDYPEDETLGDELIDFGVTSFTKLLLFLRNAPDDRVLSARFCAPILPARVQALRVRPESRRPRRSLQKRKRREVDDA